MTVEVEARGSKAIRHRVNGELVFEYAQPQLDAKKPIKDGKLLLEGGSISFQAASHSTEFRKIEIKILDE